MSLQTPASTSSKVATGSPVSVGGMGIVPAEQMPHISIGGVDQVQQQQHQVRPGDNEIMKAITTMPPYDQKSFEELRLEYYTAAKNRGSINELGVPASLSPFNVRFAVTIGKVKRYMHIAHQSQCVPHQ